MMEAVAREFDFSPHAPIRELTDDQLNVILYGAGKRQVSVRHRTGRGRTYSWKTTYEGVIPNLQRRYRDTESDHTRSEIERYMAQRACRSCSGARLRPEALGVLVCGQNIMAVTGLTIGARPAMDSQHQARRRAIDQRFRQRASRQQRCRGGFETRPYDARQRYLSRDQRRQAQSPPYPQERQTRRRQRRAGDAYRARNGHRRPDSQGD